MNRTNIAIVRTGTANLASVCAAFQRLGTKFRIVDRPSDLQPAEVVVLPGVGTFAAGMNALKKADWISPLAQRYQDDLPTLAICLGLQLLAEGSDEGPGISGLGIIPGRASKFPDNVCSPQFGWNRLEGTGNIAPNGYVYYANSYCLQNLEALRLAGWNVATSVHGIEFVAAIHRGNWLACQFHPELSSDFGLKLLGNWLQQIHSASAANERGAAC